MRRLLFLVSSVALANPFPTGVVTTPAPSGSSGSPVTQSQLYTQGPSTLLVSTTGSDTGNCTVSPCLTIDYARSQIPPNIQDNILVSVAAGTYTAGAYIAGFTFSVNNTRKPTSQTTGPALSFKCSSYSAATLASGSQTGTLTSATQGQTGTLSSGNPSIWGTFTVTGANWTVGDLAGHLIQITSGTGAGELAMISKTNANTSTVGTIDGIWAVTPDSSSHFAIVDPGCIINNVLPRPPGALGLAYSATNGSSFYVTNNVGTGWRGGGNNSGSSPYTGPAGTFEPPITIEGFKFTAGVQTATAVGISGEEYVALRFNTLVNMGEGFEFAGIGGGVWIESNNCQNSGAASSACFRTIGNDANNAGHMYVRIFGNLLTGSGRGMILRGGNGIIAQNDIETTGASGGLFIGVGINMISSGNYFVSEAVGIAMTAGAPPNMTIALESNQDTFNNNTVAVQINSGKLWFNQAQLGSGNTTGLLVTSTAGQIGPAWVEYDGASTMTSSTDITINGSSYTFAQLRAAGGNQKSIYDGATGILVHED